MPPLIAITTDSDGQKQSLRRDYATRVARAGGVPVLLPICPGQVEQYVDRFDAFIFTGGDDPNMEQWGITTHPAATRIDPDRQAFELALLDALCRRPEKPVLGICLGMQLMALHAGGAIDQHLPESDPAKAQRHWGRKPHRVDGELGEGIVLSHHRQAIIDPGALEVCATSDDRLIEAIHDPTRPFYLGVQWHPERTEDPRLGQRLFEQFISTVTAPSARTV